MIHFGGKDRQCRIKDTVLKEMQEERTRTRVHESFKVNKANIILVFKQMHRV